MNVNRRDFLHTTTLAATAAAASSLRAETPAPRQHPEEVAAHLQRLYAAKHRRFAWRDDYPGGFAKWEKEWRPELRKLIGLDRIGALSGLHIPIVSLHEPVEDLGDVTRQRGEIETEPHVTIPFWIVKPKGDGPFPFAITPHGHDHIGHDTSAGVAHSEGHEKKIIAQDRDVAVQAAKHGFLAIAPATRGLAVDGVPDVFDRHGKRDCRSQLMHCLLAGRTAIGERVWDMQRIMDWALARPDVKADHLLMMGNSGGGFVTMYAAACDERIRIAVPSCSFSLLVSSEGRIYQCDCNTVPGMLQYGEMYDVVGLIAPRHLLIVNGHGDSLHDDDDVMRSSAGVKKIYEAAGVPERFDHRWGNDGHRFYKDLMWPFIRKAMEA